jgi:hypothetical protein
VRPNCRDRVNGELNITVWYLDLQSGEHNFNLVDLRSRHLTASHCIRLPSTCRLIEVPRELIVDGRPWIHVGAKAVTNIHRKPSGLWFGCTRTTDSARMRTRRTDHYLLRIVQAHYRELAIAMSKL